MKTSRSLYRLVNRRQSNRLRFETLEDRTTPAVTITVVKSVDLAIAHPGDTLTYTVNIADTGTTDATGVQLLDAIDPNSTFVTNSVMLSPMAAKQAFNAVGNTQRTGTLTVGVHDLDGITPDAGLVYSGSGSTSAGGMVTILADGSFNYTPQTGDQSLTDTFNYTVTDGDGLASTGVVTINLGLRVWYVDSALGGGANEDGSSLHPYNSLADISGASGSDTANDIIFIRNAGSTYDGNLTLLSGQLLYGSGATFAVNTIGINAAGTNTSLQTTAAATDAITVNQNNTIRGFTIGNTTGTKIKGTSVGALTTSALTLQGSGADLDLNTGTPNMTIDSLSSTSSVNAVNLAGLNGTIAINGGAISGATGAAFIVNGGSVAITSSGNITQANNAALLSVSGGHSGATLAFSGNLNASNGTGLQFDNADGTYNFTGTNALNGGGATIDIGNGSGGSFTFGSGTSVTNSTNADVAIHNGTASVTYNGTISDNNSSGAAVNITSNTGGTIAFTGQITASTSTTVAVNLVSNTGATVNFTGGLTLTTTSGTGFNATGGGTVSVTGANNTINSTTGTALNVANTTIGGSGLTFKSISAIGGTNGMVLSSTGSGGLTVTGTGTTDGSGGSIQNTSGRGVSFISTGPISLKNMTFTNAGNTNFVDPTGSGVGNDNGSVDPANNPEFNLNANAGIHLVNITGATLDNIDLLGGAQQGINGNNVTNFVLKNSTIQGAGDQVREDGLHFKDMLGTSSITNTTFGGNTAALTNEAVQIHIENYAGAVGTSITLDNVNVQSTGLSAAPNGSHGLQFTLHDAANADLTVKNSTFNNLFSNSIQADSDSTGEFEETINNNTFTNVGAGGITSALDSNGVMRVYIHHNGTAGTPTFLSGTNNGTAPSINVNHAGNAGAASLLEATINDNYIGTPGSAMSASKGGAGIRIFSVSSGTANVKIDHNHIHGVLQGIAVSMGEDTNSNHTLNATIFNNTVVVTNNLNGFEGILINAGTSSSGGGDQGTMRLDIHDNSASTNADGGNSDFRLRERFLTNVQFLNLGGNAQTAAQVQAYLLSRSNVPAGPNSDWDIAEGNGTDGFDNTTNVPGPGLPSPLRAAPGGVAAALPPVTTHVEKAPVPQSPASGSDITLKPTAPTQSEAATETTPVTPTVPPKPLPVDDGFLSQSELDSMVSAAIDRWAATGLSAEQVAILRSMNFTVDDMPGLYLGSAAPGVVTIDSDAGSHGWFIDPTPLDDSEFGTATSATRLYTTPTEAPAGHFDLLSTVMHEFGHQLGLDDHYDAASRDDLMFGYLTFGERRLPAFGQSAGAVPHDHEHGGPDFLGLPTTIGTISAGTSITAKFKVTVNTPFPTSANKVSNIAEVTATGGIDVFSNSNTPVNTDVQYAPLVATNPADKTIDATQNTTFTATATGNPVPTVKWQVDTGGGFVDLTNAAPYSGVTTGTLTITNATTALSTNKYRAIFHNVVAPDATSNFATLTVNALPVLSPTTLPNSTAGVNYNKVVTATLGTGNKTMVVSGFNAGTTGLSSPTVGTNTVTFNQTPTAGTVSFTLIATDTVGGSVSQAYSFTINQAVALSPTTLPDSTAGVVYNKVVTASLGTGNKIMAVSNFNAGTTGLSSPTIGTNTITFNQTPTAGSVSFDLLATDTVGATASQHYAFTINPVITLTPTTLPDGNINVLYNQTVVASNGTGTKTMTVSGFNAGGTGLAAPSVSANTITFNSTPTVGGTVQFDLKADDTVGATTGVVHYTFNINATHPPVVTAASTSEDTQSTSGLVITRNPADGPEVTHFKITAITGGSLLQNNGTPLSNNDFITVADGALGLRFTPAADANTPAGGTFSFIAQSAKDNLGTSLSLGTTATITVTERNDAPTGNPDGLSSIAEDSGLRTIAFTTLTTNDSKGPANESSQSLTITNVTGAVGGTVAINGTNVEFTPTADFNGAASFDYTVQDNGTTAGAADPKTSTGHVTFTITEVNDAPTGNPDGLSSIAEDSGLRTIAFTTLTTNDSKGPANESGQALTITNVTSAVGGTVAINGTNVEFTPTADFNGAASFDYTVQDNGTTNGAADPKTSTGHVTFTITEVNDAPTGNPDGLSSIAEDSGLRNIAFTTLTTNDSKGPANESGQALTITNVTNAVGGTVAINGTNVEFTPTADFNGAASFDYTVQDNGTTNGTLDAKTATGHVTFTVTEVNDAPVAFDDTLSDVGEDSGLRSIPFTDLTTNDNKGPANESGQSLTVSAVSNPVGGTVAINGTNVEFTVAANFYGAASFDYVVRDNGTTNGAAAPLTDGGHVTFNVTASADQPGSTNATTPEDTQSTTGLVITRNPADGNEVQFFKVTAITGGTLFQNNGTTQINNLDFITVAQGGLGLKFTPAADANSPAGNFFGFNVSASLDNAGTGLSGEQGVTITVTEVNDDPTATDDGLTSVGEDSGLRSIAFAALTGNDVKGPANESGQTLTVSNVSNPIGGTVTINGGNVEFTPSGDFNGPASFDYTVQDNGTTAGVSAPKTDLGHVTFTVTEKNDAPVATDDTLSNVAEDSGLRSIPFGTLTGNDSKGPSNESGQALTIASVFNAVGGIVTINGTNIEFTPTGDYFGPASFDYTVQDNGTTNGSPDPLTDVGHASFIVTEVNDAPTANDDGLASIPEDSAQQSIPFGTLTGNDVKGPANESGQSLTIISVNNAVGGSVSINAGNVLFTPTANFNGPASFDYTVQDNGTTNGSSAPLTDIGHVTFNITPVADTPSVTNATTPINTQTTSGLVISRNLADGNEVQFFQITGITGGLLFQNNGSTPIFNNDFITFAQGNLGLKFTPNTNNASPGTTFEFKVQSSLTNNAGGLGAALATATITVTDSVAPDTIIDSGPTQPFSNSNSATFTFHGTDNVVPLSLTFERNLDNLGWVSAASPLTLNGLPEGSHTLQVRATDLAGNVDQSPASYTWNVDTMAPTVGISAPSRLFTNIAQAVTYTVRYTDANLTSVTLSNSDISLNTTNGATANVTVAPTAALDTWTVTLNNVTGNGLIGISIKKDTATDAAGNNAPAAGPSTTFEADNIKPTVAIGTPSVTTTKAGPVTFTVTVGDQNLQTPVVLTPAQVQVVGTPGTITGDVTVTPVGTNQFTVKVQNIRGGKGSFLIRLPAGFVADKAGNVSNGPVDSASVAVTGLRKLNISIGAPPAVVKLGAPLTYLIAFSNRGTQQADNVSIIVTLPAGATFNAGTSTAGWTSIGGGKFKLNLGNLAIGAHAKVKFGVILPSSPPAGGVETFVAAITDDLALGKSLVSRSVSSKFGRSRYA